MATDIFLSMALGAVFIVFGFPFALLLAGEGTIGEELRVVTMSCVLGIAMSVIICSNVISFGGSLAVALVWCLLIWFVVVLIKHPLILVGKYLRSVGFALTFVVGQSLLIGFTKPLDALFGVRIGVDAALYADGAQVMLESTGQSGLKAMSAVSSTFFGPAGLLEHLRWGTPMLMAMATKLFGLEHSYQVIMPLMAVMIASTALLVVVLCKKLKLPHWVSLFTGVMVVLNYPLLHLVIEGQWAQAMSVPVIISIFVLRLSDSSQTWSFVILNAILIAAAMLFYGEYLPILLGVLVGATLIEVGTEGIVRSTKLLAVLVGSVAIAGLLIYPYTEKYLGHLFELSLSVGYPTPHHINGSEIFGIGSIWSRWEDWMNVKSTPIQLVREHKLLDDLLCLVFIVLTRWGLFNIVRHQKNWELWIAIAGMGVLLWFRFSLNLNDGYLWSKSITTLTPMLTIAMVYGIWTIHWQSYDRQWPRVVFISVAASCVFLTEVRGIIDFRESSRTISSDVIEIRDYLNNHQDCLVVLAEKGSTNGGLKMFVRDTVFNNVMTPLLRRTPILDGHTFVNFQGKVESLPKNICLVLDSSGLPEDTRSLWQSGTVLFKNSHWVIIDLGSEFENLMEMDAHEFYIFTRGLNATS